MKNTGQLLQSVVDRPRNSNVDIKILTHIWDAFCKWTSEQFDAKKGVRVFGFGEFCFREDKIGGMEFVNPMFIMNEGYARAYRLHDRRPKTYQAANALTVEVDIGKIAQMATDLAAEIITKDVVEYALKDVFDRLGEFCADEKQGVVTVDFKMGKLVCENKSVEFHFQSADERQSAVPKLPPPSRGSRGGLPSYRSRTASREKREKDFSLAGGAPPGMNSSPPPMKVNPNGQPQLDPPLQRYKKPQLRPATKLTPQDLLLSHETQLLDRHNDRLNTKHQEDDLYENDLNRLRGEMVQEFEDKAKKRLVNQEIAEIQKQQTMEKKLRDVEDRRVMGMQHWPFRTEEEVQHANRMHNQQLRENLDQQMMEKEQRRRMHAEMVAASVPPRPDPKDIPPPQMRSSQAGQQTVETAVDDAYQRYEDYLKKRKDVEKKTRGYVDEQRFLSEQAEVLKMEENRRRMTEMQDYLKEQMREKHLKDEREKMERRNDLPQYRSTSLPMHPDRDLDEEHYVKLALRHALDQQVSEKVDRKEKGKEDELQQQQHLLNCVAVEMNNARQREVARKKETQLMLNETWAKQRSLKHMEKSLA